MPIRPDDWTRMRAVFEHALALPEPGRSHYVADACEGRDTRLGRPVAIKVLPSHVATDPQARERFDREARAIATLNHPQICVLHDIGEAIVPASDAHMGRRDPVAVRYLVMELLEGETLASQLTRGPLPVEEPERG